MNVRMNTLSTTGGLRAAVIGLAMAAVIGTAVAQDDKKKEAAAPAQTLEQLLEQTRNVRAREAEANKARESRFLSDRNRQAELLNQARAEKAAQEARAVQLGKTFDDNEKKLTELQGVLDAKGGNLGELFGVVRIVAGDVASVLFNSHISAQYPKRDVFIAELAQSKALPSIEKLEKLWFEMQREMTETGRSVRFKTKIVEPDGEAVDTEVVRVGAFIAVTEDRFLNYLPTVGQLAVLPRQPESPLPGIADSYVDTDSGYEKMVVDPARGVLLSLTVQRASWLERIYEHGELVGAVIIVIGLAGAGLGVYQFFFLRREKAAVKRQLGALDRPALDNPLGRVLASFKGDAAKVDEDAEVIELRISEAVLKEVPKLERFQSFLRLAVAAGPLLGLVGTVIGMIITFQSITESGSGDPKLMATGIGQAMIATVLGLGIAIPLLFMNAVLQALSRSIIQILDEQSAGLLAERLEKQRRA